MEFQEWTENRCRVFIDTVQLYEALTAAMKESQAYRGRGDALEKIHRSGVSVQERGSRRERQKPGAAVSENRPGPRLPWGVSALK
jgi:hypothetical protein